jgi:sensor histidine kinase YesM
MQMQIPKFLIQIHAENALKHGLAPLETGGFLKIELKNTDSVLQIEIHDNGVGRKNASLKKGQSTGKGLEIMNELYSLYNKYYSEKIEAEIIDLSDNDGKPSGTRVLINIKRSETAAKA